MIIDKLENLSKYTALHPLLAQAADYLCTHDLLAAEVGTTVLKAGELRVTVAQTSPKTKEEAWLEAHRQFIDIQVPLSGVEYMGYSPLNACKTLKSAYDSTKDILFFQDEPQNYLRVEPGMFVIFFPQDAHAPGITASGVKKIIIKINA